MIGDFLDKLFSGQNIKRMASFLFCLPIIVGIISGIINDEGNKFLFMILFIIIGFIFGIILSFTWHVLGQILDYLSKIRNNLKILNDKFSENNTKTLFENVMGTRNDVHIINNKVK